MRVYRYTMRTKARKLKPMTVRISPVIYRRMEEVIRRRPHLSLNVLVNEILERELTPSVDDTAKVRT